MLTHYHMLDMRSERTPDKPRDFGDDELALGLVQEHLQPHGKALNRIRAMVKPPLKPVTISHNMNSLRIARAAARARPSAIGTPLQRRGYADAVSDKIKLTLALPHQVCQSLLEL